MKKYINIEIMIMLKLNETYSENIARNKNQISKEYLDGLIYLNVMRQKDPIDKEKNSKEEIEWKKIVQAKGNIGKLFSYENCELNYMGDMVHIILLKVKLYESRKEYMLSKEAIGFLIQDVSEVSGIYAKNFICNGPGLVMDIKEMKIRQAKITKKKNKYRKLSRRI